VCKAQHRINLLLYWWSPCVILARSSKLQPSCRSQGNIQSYINVFICGTTAPTAGHQAGRKQEAENSNILAHLVHQVRLSAAVLHLLAHDGGIAGAVLDLQQHSGTAAQQQTGAAG
jgi:acetylglutamate synthase